MPLRRAALALAATAPFALAACLHAPFDASRLDARAVHDSVTTDAGQATFHAIPFPPRARTRPTRLPLVVVEPVLFQRALLLEHGGLVATLEDAGFAVWLVGADADVPCDTRTFASGIARSIGSVARATGSDHVSVLSLDLSGPAMLGAFDALRDPASPVHIDKLAFLGAPLDEAYPSSFASRTQAIAGGPASALCALESNTACARTFREPAAAAWLGALPPSDADDTRRARDRYPNLPRFDGTSVLFIAGKVDGVAPTESSFPVYEAWGSEVKTPSSGRKRFFVAGLENGLGREYDAFGLLAREANADVVWDQVIAFFRE